jgi:hypothetical protein
MECAAVPASALATHIRPRILVTLHDVEGNDPDWQRGAWHGGYFDRLEGLFLSACGWGWR